MELVEELAGFPIPKLAIDIVVTTVAGAVCAGSRVTQAYPCCLCSAAKCVP